MKLIDKDAVITEIKNCIDRCNAKKRSCPVNTQVEAICDNKIYAYKEVLSCLDTLEVKDMNEVPANVMLNQYDNKYISSWSGLKEYNNFQLNEEIKILIPSK